ncbi:hypothetical protein D6C90_03105 [Aureobasidium pullulans]|uniref:Uncharacterized protein n=1 Tax=Aureobasidium pullulans TaxID=5580 RepID=A0A4S9VD94_AURPU|nr:hypothetical protein D6C90_03105 [Aureobasidium pullulans]
MANIADSWPVMSEQAADDVITRDSWSVSNEIHHGAKSLESESEAEPICRRRSVSRPRLPFLGTYAISSVPHPHLFRPLSTTQSSRLEPFVPFEDTLLDGFDIEALDLNLFNSINGSTDHQDDVFLDVITSIPESQIVESQSQPNAPDEAEVLVSEAPDELEIRSSRSVAHPSLTLHDISVDWTSIYKGYWGNNCLSALHPVFHKITDLISQVPVLEDAIVALAACNLSRSSPKPKSPGVAGNVSYQPHPEHWASSQQHYRSALTATQHMTEAVTQAEKLIIWEQNLPLADLPASLDGEVQYLVPEGLLVNPLQFSSHNAAMNYAYFISARLMQDAPIDLSGEHITDSDHWVFLLLRITAGIDRQTCLRDNTYTIGLSSLLLAALLHTCSLDIGIWIEDWLQGFQKNAQSPALEEGSFPLAQITTVVSVINQQRRLGRNVFAVSQAEDDGGGNGKVDSYDSQDIKVIAIAKSQVIVALEMSITSRHREEVARAISEHIMSLKEDEEYLEKASPDTDTVVADDSTAGTLTPTSTIAAENDEATCSIVIKVYRFPTSSSELHVKINRWGTFEKLLRHLQVPDQFPRRLELTHEGRKLDIFESDTPASVYNPSIRHSRSYR